MMCCRTNGAAHADRQPVRLDSIVQVIGGDYAAGPGHLFDDPGRITRQMLVDVPRITRT
jgi:hypothetical protein